MSPGAGSSARAQGATQALAFCHKGVNNPKHRPEFSSPGLVNASPSVIQVEFCLSKDVNAVVEEYYCARLLPNMICLGLEINMPSTRYGVVSCLEKNPCSTCSLLSVCFNPTTVRCVPLLFFFRCLLANFLVADEEDLIRDTWHTVHFLYLLWCFLS